ncbi:hypothetical protein D3C83_44430 [compost metagenome]
MEVEAKLSVNSAVLLFTSQPLIIPDLEEMNIFTEPGLVSKQEICWSSGSAKL